MEGNWNVYYEEKTVGSCRICREGLYFRLSCRCARVTEGICRLILQCGENAMDLGILVPMENGFGLDKKMPAKHLPQGHPRLSVKVLGRNQEVRFVPVRDGEAFAYLSGLVDARFACRNGEVGVILK